MDDVTVKAAAFEFLVMLPLCLLFVTYLVLAAGHLTHKEDQPIVFRVFVATMGPRDLSSSLPGAAIVALPMLAVFNLVPVIALVAHKNGPGPVVVSLAYFLVVAAWVATVIAAIRHEDSRDIAGFTLVILGRTGVTYTQPGAGGREVEASAMPLPGGHAAIEPIMSWYQHRFGYSARPGDMSEWDCKHLNELLAKVDLGAELSGGSGGAPLTLDRTRLSEIGDGWIPVTSPRGAAILVWES